ncbi:MAG TPA: FUSC family protein [Aliidongia sp.]|nr:FUSC family protein [Aliidongia sp.]
MARRACYRVTGSAAAAGFSHIVNTAAQASGTPTANTRLWATWVAARPCLLFGLRLWASVSLALALSFWLQLDNAYWSATSASIVCQPSLGASLRKGRFRAIGTITGAVAIVGLTALYPQSRIGLLAGLTLWCALCAFAATILRNFASYAAALAGVTSAVVFAGAAGDPDSTFTVAVTRATEIGIGIVAAGLVLAVTDFGKARQRLAQELGDAARRVAAGLLKTLESGLDAPATRRERLATIRHAAGLDTVIDEVTGEAAGDLRTRSRALQAAVEGLFTALSAWRGVANHLQTLPPGTRVEGAEAVRTTVAAVAAGAWIDSPEAVRRTCETEARDLLARAAPDVEARLMMDGVAHALGGLARTANGLVLVTRHGTATPDHGLRRLYVPDVLPAVINALRAIIALLLAEFFWIESDWSSGPLMITFTAVGVTIFAPRAEEAYHLAAGYALGTVATAALAAVVNFAVLPALDGFVGLALVLAAVMVPLGTLFAMKWRASWQQSALLALVTNFFPMLGPENQQVYSPEAFYNSALAIVVGTIAASMALCLIPPLPAAWRRDRLLDLTLRDLRRLAVRTRRPDRRGWIGLVCRRVAALPAEASLEDGARLVAALSAGTAIIDLKQARARLAEPAALDRALAALARADLAGTRAGLDRLDAHAPDGGDADPAFAMRVRAAAAVIGEALARHPGFFGSAVFSSQDHAPAVVTGGRHEVH